MPATGIELGPDTYILEAGFEQLNGVDFKKGCFVGQEIVARMKHKTELRKGIVQVRIEGNGSQGDEITKDGKSVWGRSTPFRGMQASPTCALIARMAFLTAGEATLTRI